MTTFLRGEERLDFTIAFMVALFSIILGLYLRSEAQEKSQASVVPRDEALVIQKLPILSDLVRPYEQVYEPFLEYAVRILKPDWIETEDDLLSVFSRKAELIKLLLDHCSGPLEKIASP